VLKGSVIVEHDGGPTTVTAGQSIITHAGERIRYSTGDEGAEDVAVCTPAFSPDTVGRED
jgi:quercetin dioxygenase-like cupin family protein